MVTLLAKVWRHKHTVVELLTNLVTPVLRGVKLWVVKLFKLDGPKNERPRYSFLKCLSKILRVAKVKFTLWWRPLRFLLFLWLLVLLGLSPRFLLGSCRSLSLFFLDNDLLTRLMNLLRLLN
jgi:hypothetical protein